MKPTESEKFVIDSAMLQNLFKDDQVLCDPEMNMYSLNPELQRSMVSNPNSKFELFSDRMLRMFPSYRLDKSCRFQPGEMTPTVNFTDLKAILLGKDDRSF